MIVIWGSGMYGKVDEVPGVCHVATQFGHLYYVPLIPLGSYAVTGHEGEDIRGAALPLSFKSILTAWLRTVFFLGGTGLLIGGVVLVFQAELLSAAGLLVSSALLWTAWYYSYRWLGKASYERAVDIGRRLGLNHEGMLMLDVAYGRLTAEQALAELERLAPADE